ncbi:Hypothetical predicted protein [Cloeon dipterum]|uniref:Uncharacterized protein n=1 Tax=Cloeon dipterum TaxID=197152 RepID=A0A8S1DIN3_9INSE|nr:Hypothetical predicted protein [Cloeon dipterum]
MNDKIGVFQSLIIENDDSGILYDILATKATIDRQSAIKEVGCWIVTKFKKSPMIFRQKNIREAPEPVDITSMISEHPPFSFQETLASIKKDRYNNINDNTMPECVIGFQKRIKDMVLNCIGGHLTEEWLIVRDWQVVQYLLPCFVASYQDICESTPPVDEAIKQRKQ